MLSDDSYSAVIEYADEADCLTIRMKNKEEALAFARELLAQIEIIDKSGRKFSELALIGIDLTKKPKSFPKQNGGVCTFDHSPSDL